jgi:hypothetical protein
MESVNKVSSQGVLQELSHIHQYFLQQFNKESELTVRNKPLMAPIYLQPS